MDEGPVTDPREIIRLFCELQRDAADHLGWDEPSDCFCGYNGVKPEGYQNSGRSLRFIERVVREAIKQRGLEDE